MIHPATTEISHRLTRRFREIDVAHRKMRMALIIAKQKLSKAAKDMRRALQ